MTTPAESFDIDEDRFGPQDEFLPVAPDDTDLSFSIDCPTCGSGVDTVCQTDDGYADDDVVHAARQTCAIVACNWQDDPYLFRAVRFDAPWSGGCSPVIDEWVRDELQWRVENPAELMALTPDAEGLFHLLPLGWTFAIERDAR